MNNNFAADGFCIIDNIYSSEETDSLLRSIAKADTNQPAFRKTNELFAIRQFFKAIPAALPLVFNKKLKKIISEYFGNDFFVVKSIYFDKPETSNWFVAYHQDLTISVNKKTELENYGPWTVKQDQFAVQPPLDILENNCTLRIHLDHTNEENGALKVIPGSHLKKIYRPENIDWKTEKELFCPVQKGGLMIMKPLLLHASNRTTNHHKRRVIHIEMSDRQLPDGIKWAEFSAIPDN